jgi:tRNA A37 N6-isopentenylltransferase MiaA
MADVSLNLYDALAADPRLQNQADPNNAYRVARLGELWQTLQTNLSNSES